jgi:hypothetical protein
VLKGTDRLVVGLDGTRQALAGASQVVAEGRKAPVHFSSYLLDLASVVGERPLLPYDGHRAEQRYQVDRRRQQDPLGKGVLEEVGVLLEGCCQLGVAGDEGDYELW